MNETIVNEDNLKPASAFQAIKSIDYTVILVRNMKAMRIFYEETLGFVLLRELSQNWIEYQIGANILALSNPGFTALDDPLPSGSAALQLAFKVSPTQVDACAKELNAQNIKLVSPPTDQDFGHRTMFFRDPDGNLLEIYAEI